MKLKCRNKNHGGAEIRQEGCQGSVWGGVGSHCFKCGRLGAHSLRFLFTCDLCGGGRIPEWG